MRVALAGVAAVLATLASAGTASAVPALQMVTPLSSDYHMGDNNIPSATVWLSEPAANDTVVSVISSNPGTVSASGPTVLAGQSSAQILISCLGTGSATLTSTLGTDHLDVAVRCLAVGSPIVSLDKAFGSAVTGDPFTVTATSAGGATAVEDPSYRLTVTGANPGTENKFIVAGINPPVTNPPVSFTYSGANAGSDQLQVCLLDGSTSGSGCTSYETIAVTRIAPVASSTPASLDFGQQAIGSHSSAKAVTISNAGSVNLTLGAASVSGPAAGDFEKSADACSGQTIAPGGSCEIDVKMAATATGRRDATLTVPSNDPANANLTTSLTGTGFDPNPPAGDSSTPPPAPVPSPQSAPTVTPFKATFKRDKKSGGLILAIQLPGTGKVAFVAKSGKRIVGRVKGAGTGAKKLVLVLKPSKVAKASLKKHRSLRVKVTGTFTPAAGGSASFVSFKSTFVRAKR